jgi:hypothetical protein
MKIQRLGCQEKKMLLNTNIMRLLGLAALILVLLAGVSQAQKAPGPEAAALKDIKVIFKLDPRVTQGMYMGERWISPPKYTRVQEGKKPLMIEAKAMGLDAQGKEAPINPVWTSAEPETVKVAPGQGHQVELTVLRAGETKLKIEFQGISKTLSVKGKPLGNFLIAEITQ